MELKQRICCICGSDREEELLRQPVGEVVGLAEEYVQRIVICRECGLVYAAPVPAPAELARYYATLSNYENPQSGGENTRADKNKFDRMFDSVTSRFPEGFTGRALDIGCAVAYGLSLFKQRGWEVLGIDPSPRCAELSERLYGVPVRTATFPGEAELGRFDLVILSHVVEHLVQPASLLARVRDLLADGGLVYIEVPNLLQSSGAMCHFTFEHVNYFTPATLSQLLQQAGFEPDQVCCHGYSPEVMPFYPVIAATWRKCGGRPPLGNDYREGVAAVRRYQEASAPEVRRLQLRVAQILSQVSPGRLAIWGGGSHTGQLLSLTPLGRENVACIFDNDPKKVGLALAGIGIVPFNPEPARLRERIDAIVISTKAGEPDVYRQLRHLEAEGITIFRLYGTDPR